MKVSPKKIIVSRDVTEAVSRIKAAFVQLGDELVGRTAELDAIRLAMITYQNVMLDGLHGTAKSLLARKVFSRVTGPDIVVFRKQLMKATQTDELFGPMNSKKYREQAIWEHNTEGMLPEAHFAFLDEVYRGSDMLLPSILGILNEREFINGAILMKCPLITAIGTTNFITDNSELDAFNDRWLFRIKVQPLSNSALRLNLLRQWSSSTRVKIVEKTFTMEDLTDVHQAINRVPFADDALDVYEETVNAFRKAHNNIYVSDRRLCQTLDVLRAQALFDNPEEPEVSVEHVAAAVHGIAFRKTPEEDAFNHAAESVVGSYAQYTTENEELKTLEDFLTQVTEQFSNPKTDLKELRKNVVEIYHGVQQADASERPKKPENIARMETVVNELGDLLNSIENKLTVRKK